MRKATCAMIAGVLAAAAMVHATGHEEAAGGDSGPGPNDIAVVKEAKPAPLAPKTRSYERAIVGPISRQPQGVLSGKIAYVGAGHGWTASTSGAWSTQRGNNNGMVEDLGNIDQLTIFVEYLYNAGATIVPFRPVGNQTNEVVLDNDDPGVEFIPDNAWQNSTNPQYFGDASDAVHYRYASISPTETAVARYTPSLPEAGFYPVYAWTRDGSDRVEDQIYRIVHTGGATEVQVNHRRVGKGWIYLGEYYFESGTSGYVEIPNTSQSTTGDYVFADAIRFGNGMGDIDRGAGVSGHPRSDEASRYWIQRGLGQGADSSIYDQPGLIDSDDNVSAPTRMTAWMNNSEDGVLTDRIYLGFHSNAFDPGSLGLYNGNNLGDLASTPNQEQWAFIIANELNSDLVAIGSPPFEHPWPDRVAQGRSLTLDRSDIEFGEIRGDRINDEMDATIIEVAAHGNQTEAELMRDLKVRRAVARGSLQAMIRYFNEFGGNPLVFPPDTPGDVWSRANADGTVTLGWSRPDANDIVGDVPTGYAIYTSPNGYGFARLREVSGADTTTTIINDIPQGETCYFRIAAMNAGGESPWSEPVVIRSNGGLRSRALIVNGFDRIDRFMSPDETYSGLGTIDRVKERLINAQDYVVQHAEALGANGVSIDSCANEAVINGSVDLADYVGVFWICGEESTTYQTLNATERSLVTSYQNLGGNLFITGAEIGWHLDQGGVDPEFFNDVIHANWATDDAQTYVATGATGSILEGINGMNFSPNGFQYDADFPDTAQAINGSIPSVMYSTGTVAGIQYDGPGADPRGRVIYFGFPYELIQSEPQRIELMRRVTEFFSLEDPEPNTWIFY